MPEKLLRVAVAGEVIVDLVPADVDGMFRAVPGGSPANVAVGLHRLDVPTRLVARLAGDPMGRRLRRHLEANGLDLSHVVAADEPSSLAIVSVEQDGTVGYDFRVDGTADWQWTDDELSDVVDNDVVALHVGSLAAAIEPGASALRRLVERVRAETTISFDPNVRPLLMGRREDVVTRVEGLVVLADVVKASAEDLAWLYPGDPPPTVAARWLGLGPSLVAITLGSDGVLAVGSGTAPVHRPAVPVAVVDTVGAGDAFMAALLAGLSKRDLLGRAQAVRLAALAGAELAAALDDAALAAALTCARPGADPPSAEQLRQARQVVG
jgi:fructokinase